MSRTSRFDSSRGGALADRLDLLIRSGEAGSVSGAGAGVVSCFCCSQIGCFFLVVTTVHPQFGMAGIGRIKKAHPGASRALGWPFSISSTGGPFSGKAGTSRPLRRLVVQTPCVEHYIFNGPVSPRQAPDLTPAETAVELPCRPLPRPAP